MNVSKLFLLALSLFPLASAQASTTPEYNRQRLATLEAHRTATDWACRKGTNREAVVMFRVSEDVSYVTYGTRILAIKDEQICKALDVTCPFVGGVGPARFPELDGRAHAYASITGKYEDGVAFFSEGPGMKLATVATGSQVYILPNLNWYFNAGECTLVNR